MRLQSISTIALLSCLLLPNPSLSQDSCSSFTLDDVKYDLSALTQSTRPYEYVTKQPDGSSQVFYANICGGLGFVKSCPSAMEGTNAMTARLTASEGCVVLGQQAPATFGWKRVGGKESLVAHLKAQGGGESTIELICDTAPALARTGNLTTVEYSPEKSFAQFYIATGLVCGKPSPGGSGSGGEAQGSSSSGIHTVVVVLLLAGLLYCVIGFAWNVRQGEAVGVEAIPNYAFWKEIPAMVMESTSGLVHYVRNAFGGRGSVDGGTRESSSTGRYSEI